MKRALLILVPGLLAGCASPPPTYLSQAGYTSVAQDMVGSVHCVADGHISAEVGALAQTYAQSHLNQYTYYPAMLESEMSRVRAIPVGPTAEQCSQLAMVTLQRKQQISNANAAAAQEQQVLQNLSNSTRPKQTYCNQIGTQILCNSY